MGAQGSPRGSFCGPRGGLVGLGAVLGRGRTGSERGRCFWAPLAGGRHPGLSRAAQPAPAQLRARLPASLAGAPPGLASGPLPAPPPPAVWPGSVYVAGLGVEPCLPPRLLGKSCPPGVLSFPSSTTGGPWFSPLMSYRPRPGLLSLASGQDAPRPVEDAGKGLCRAVGTPPPAPPQSGKQARAGCPAGGPGAGPGACRPQTHDSLGPSLLEVLRASVCSGSGFFLQEAGAGQWGSCCLGTPSRGGWAARSGGPWPSWSSQGLVRHKMSVLREHLLLNRPAPIRELVAAGGRGPWEFCLGQRGVASATKQGRGQGRGLGARSHLAIVGPAPCLLPGCPEAPLLLLGHQPQGVPGRGATSLMGWSLGGCGACWSLRKLMTVSCIDVSGQLEEMSPGEWHPARMVPEPLHSVPPAPALGPCRPHFWHRGYILPFLNFVERCSPRLLWLFLAGRDMSPHHAQPPPQDCAGCRGRGFWTQAWPLWAPSPPPRSKDLASCPAICHPEPCGWRGSSGGPAGTLPTWASPSGPTCQDLGQPPECVDKKRDSRKWGGYARQWAGFRWGQVGRVCAPGVVRGRQGGPGDRRAGTGDPGGRAGLVSQAVVGLGSAPGPRLGLCLAQAAMSGAGDVQRGTRGGWGWPHC